MTPSPAFLDQADFRSDSVETTALTAEAHDIDAHSMKVTELTFSELTVTELTVTEPFVGQWNSLISQTNWEKGKIISQWRRALIDSAASPSAFSDETWSKQVGAVTSQHVGRLRRVSERFAVTQGSFPGLYWSHFLAGLDWDDAELWLEGAMRSKWSISEMRKMRWEASGSDPKQAPRDEELITSEVDDDFNALTADEESDRAERDRIEASGPLSEGPDFGDEDQDSDKSRKDREDAGVESESYDASKETGNPFANLPNLPPDIADALELFKLSIVRHRSNHWTDVSQSSMLDVLDALKSFVAR